MGTRHGSIHGSIHGDDRRLTHESAFEFWTSESIRLEDVDGFDHVSNITFAVYAESGRLEFLDRVTPPGVLGEGRRWDLLEIGLRFLERTHYPGEIQVGTGTLDLGRSWAVLGQGLFEGSTCVATAEAVIGLVHAETDRSVSLPAAVRTALLDHPAAPRPSS